MRKICFKCEKEKDIRSFYKHSQMKDGHLNKCKLCTRKDTRNITKYDYTEKGVIRVIYKSQKSNSKANKRDIPNYTKEDLKIWLYSKGYKKLYNRWADSGYKKDLKPSVDRLNELKPYSLDNIRLVTWGINRRNSYADAKLGLGTSGNKCKAVIQMEKDETIVKEYVSISEAGRRTGIDFRLISNACNNKAKTANGYKWKFAIK